MKIEKGIKICLDTNILLDATDEGRSLHEKALELINSFAESGATVYLPTQVIREYLVAATRFPNCSLLASCHKKNLGRLNLILSAS